MWESELEKLKIIYCGAYSNNINEFVNNKIYLKAPSVNLFTSLMVIPRIFGNKIARNAF